MAEPAGPGPPAGEVEALPGGGGVQGGGETQTGRQHVNAGKQFIYITEKRFKSREYYQHYKIDLVVGNIAKLWLSSLFKGTQR